MADQLEGDLRSAQARLERATPGAEVAAPLEAELLEEWWQRFLGKSQRSAGSNQKLRKRFEELMALDVRLNIQGLQVARAKREVLPKP